MFPGVFLLALCGGGSWGVGSGGLGGVVGGGGAFGGVGPPPPPCGGRTF